MIRSLVLITCLAALPASAADKHDQPKTSAGQFEGEFDEFEGEFGKSKEQSKVSDPLRGYNRFMFKFNDIFYTFLAKPVARVYGFIIPQPLRVGINNAYTNLLFPVRFVNSGLQGKLNGAGREMGRFLVNSTLGIGGLMDPAGKWFHIEPSDEDFGQTMGFYGIGHGPPLVLPLLGQNNLRDSLGLVPNFLLNPIYYVSEPEVLLAVTAGGHFNRLSLHIGEYEKIKKEALDPYTFIRDAHLQNRESKIKE